jgi:phage terminase large subunit-like protein
VSTAEREGRRRTAARSRRDASSRTRARSDGSRPRRRPEKPTWRVSSAGVRYGLFAFKYLRHSKGRWAGRPLSLEPWQLLTFSELLELERDAWLDLTDADAHELLVEPETFWTRLELWRNGLFEKKTTTPSGLRIHREGLLGVPKKNGKSTGSSGTALYLLVGDGEPGAEVYSTAAAKEQARIVFRQAVEMCRASPKLLDHVRIYRDAIELRKDGSFYKVVSADAPTQEGINPHGVLNDEVHAHKSRDLYDVLRSATIGRDQPLLFSFTTAGVDLKTIGGELYQRGAGKRPKYVRRHEAGDDVALVEPRADKQRSFYFRWYQANPEKVTRRRRTTDGYKTEVDLEEIKRANPSSFITKEKLQEESEVERPFAIFLRYHANVWARVGKHLFKPGEWERLRGRRGDETCRADRRSGEQEIRAGDPIVVGVDVGQLHDTSAITWARPPRLGKLGDPEDPIALDAWVAAVWPSGEDNPIDLGKAHHVEETDEPLRLELLTAKIHELATTYRVLAVAADPYKFETQLQELEDEGFVAIRFDQGAAMVRATDVFFRTVRRGYAAHRGDPVLDAHIEAAAARDVPGGRFRLDKGRASEVMDAAVSTAIAVDLCHNRDVVRARRPSVTVL